MKNLRLAAAASIAATVSVSSAGAAHAYPDSPNITINLPSSTLYGGDGFTFTAVSDVDCDWTITYNDGRASGVAAVQTGTGKSITGSYRTRVVSAKFTSPLVATCAYDDGSPRPVSSGGSVAKSSTASASATVTLLPRDSSGGGDSDSDAGTGNGEEGGNTNTSNTTPQDNSALPDTGGSNLWIVVAGGALVLVGGGAVIASRRRKMSH